MDAPAEETKPKEQEKAAKVIDDNYIKREEANPSPEESSGFEVLTKSQAQETTAQPAEDKLPERKRSEDIGIKAFQKQEHVEVPESPFRKKKGHLGQLVIDNSIKVIKGPAKEKKFDLFD